MLQYPVKDDAILKTLACIIKQGWPESKLHFPLEVQDYFPFKEELTLQNGVIFKGDRVVIPLQMRAELRRKLHSSHLGVQTCQRRAQKVFYWPGMYKEIEEIEEYVSERLFRRRTKTLLPTSGRLLRKPEFDTTSQLLHAQKNKQAFYYNNGTKELWPLEPGNTIRIHPPKYSQQWTPATVNKQVGVCSYQVITDEGRMYRRNR